MMHDEEDINQWYIKHKQKMLDGDYYDPCKGCSGEDCLCCSYGNGY